MKTKHTPGPWMYGELAEEVFAMTRKGPMAIAACPQYDRWGNPPEVKPTWEANARLIAAAPELLDALKGLEHFASYVAVKNREADWGEVIAAAKVAIAKAEGK